MTRNRRPGAAQPDSGLHWTDLLLTHPEVTPTYILEISDGLWECRCGNVSESEGFIACDELGQIVERILGPWNGSSHLCPRCWRIINGDTLEVLGFAAESVIEWNEEFRWVPHF